MNHQRRLLTREEQGLTQKLSELKRRRGRSYEENHLSTLAQKWNIRRGGVIGFMTNYLENPARWLNDKPEKQVKGKGITLGNMMSTRMYDYLEVLGYQPEEIKDFFKLAGRVNENYKTPKRERKYSPTSLDCYEGVNDKSTRDWLLKKFKGELG